MNTAVPFKIYNASAGSGKTFTLVKQYLKRILSASNENYYQQLLAITFTNKAVAEMKLRILDSLVEFSNATHQDESPEMMLQIASELALPSEEIQKKSKRILKHLLHHYAGFSVETIDRFNHRLLRTFAKDLKLATNFEVSLDTPQLLAEAVDQLISKAGQDSNITKVLLEFALEKTDDDKSWDISKDIVNASKILFEENEPAHLEKLKSKSLSDFSAFKKHLLLQKKELSEKIIAISNQTLELIETNGLQHSDFSGSYLPKHFIKLQSGIFNINFSTRWQEDIAGSPLYTATTAKKSPELAAIIDGIATALSTSFDNTKTAVHKLLLTESILKNLTPLFVINLVNQELSILKEEKNIIPISEFNSLINKEIKDQPAPFIYERLGEKYRHFFIDEFQDTSQLQWENLIPLVDNAMVQLDANGDSGSLLLVGDAKQSIYRWRGGLPEQFMGLYGALNPFPASEKLVLNLDTNYRSSQEIISFNNDFFSFIAPYFDDSVHFKLYEIGNNQKSTQKKDGFVRIEFNEKDPERTKDEIYAAQVYQTILDLKSNGFEESDICILTRKKKDGIALGGFLMEQGISIISSETLLLQTSLLVQCIVNTLKISVYPENDEAKIELLDMLHEHLGISEEKHSFFEKFLKTTIEEFETQLTACGISCNFKDIQEVSLYESCEYIIRSFGLQKDADAYLFSFMDLVFEFEQKPQATKIAFLEYWEIQKEKASIPANEGAQAIQLMTIHKSKGLEFPVVLFPYADLNLYDTRSETVWYPLDPDENSGFSEAQINYKKELASYSEIGETLYNERRNMLQLDNLNLLYVTLTRAVEQLYIFSEMPSKRSGETSTYNQFFSEFLQKQDKWVDGQLIYEFGNAQRTLKTKVKEIVAHRIPKYLASTPEDHQLKIVTSEASLWDTAAQNAIQQGNILHDIMAEIKTKADIEPYFESISKRSIYTSEVINTLYAKVRSIVTHPQLEHLFENGAEVRNEGDIITATGMLLRPDRLNMLSSNLVTIVDYKTGTPNYHHEDQINSYGTALEQMGKKVSEKLLVYTSEEEIIINKV